MNCAHWRQKMGPSTSVETWFLLLSNVLSLTGLLALLPNPVLVQLQWIGCQVTVTYCSSIYMYVMEQSIEYRVSSIVRYSPKKLSSIEYPIPFAETIEYRYPIPFFGNESTAWDALANYLQTLCPLAMLHPRAVAALILAGGFCSMC